MRMIVLGGKLRVKKKNESSDRKKMRLNLRMRLPMFKNEGLIET